jgi:hypothetical protein
MVVVQQGEVDAHRNQERQQGQHRLWERRTATFADDCLEAVDHDDIMRESFTSTMLRQNIVLDYEDIVTEPFTSA